MVENRSKNVNIYLKTSLYYVILSKNEVNCAKKEII